MTNLLQGVRVLELAVLLNGDTVGMHLGDLGADVIKVESPPHGDYLRYFLGQVVPGVSVAHAQVNRNKRSVLLDLSNDSDRDQFLELVDTAEIVVDGNLPGVCERLGVGADVLLARKPSLVYVQHSGFGATAPYASIPTHGVLMNALAGACLLAVDEDGLVTRRPPERPGAEMGGEATSVGALHAVTHALAAVLRARATGGGAYIDVAASDAVIATAWLPTVLALNDEQITDRSGMAEMDGTQLSGSRYQFYETSDGRFVLFGCIEQRFWDRWALAIDRPDMVGRVGNGGNAEVEWGDRTERLEIAEIMRSRTQAEWVKLAAACRFALAPAYQKPDEVISDPQIAARNVFVSAEHPLAGPISLVGAAAVVDGAGFRVRRHAPSPGEHTAEVLAEIEKKDAPHG
ncbi:MAG: CaiB/BaiF CoA transferase family protein [Aeromicrobium sp.]